MTLMTMIIQIQPTGNAGHHHNHHLLVLNMMIMILQIQPTGNAPASEKVGRKSEDVNGNSGGFVKIMFTEDVMMNMTKMTMTLMDHD